MATAYSPLPRPLITRGQRDHSRARLSLPARLMTFNGTETCTLVDLSCAGAKISAREIPRIGSMVVVEGLPIELFGTVRWSLHGLFGFEFEKPLPVAQVIQLRHLADGESARQKAAYTDYVRGWVTGVYSNTR